MAAAALSGTAVSAADTVNVKQDAPKPEWSEIFNWSLLYSGSWEEAVSASLEGTLNNRADVKIGILPADLTLRTQVLDKRPFNFNPENFQWDTLMGDQEKWVTNFTGGIYHKASKSRLLYGVIDESGLSARIRNPWIRSPSYTENHEPSIAELKTLASGTKEDELYLYLSGPDLRLSQDTKLQGHISAQTETGALKNTDLAAKGFTGGFNFLINKNINLQTEIFFTEKTLQQTKPKTWFSDPPRLPDRDFRLFAAAALLDTSAFSIGSDFAFSSVFARGADIYANFGVTVKPLLSFENITALTGRQRPLSISIAAEGAGKRFVSRDGVNHGENFRGAVKIEWMNRYSSLLRVDFVLRGDGFGGDFYKSSTGIYYRFPSSVRINSNLFRLTTISLSADRDAENLKKIIDTFTGTIGMRINPRQSRTDSPFGFNFSGSITGVTESDDSYFIFPVPEKENAWLWDSVSLGCEITWSPGIFRFRLKTVFINYPEKSEKWDISAGISARFRHGRISLSFDSPDFPKKRSWALSWQMEATN